MSKEQEFWDALNRRIVMSMFLKAEYDIVGHVRNGHKFWFRFGGRMWREGIMMELNLN